MTREASDVRGVTLSGEHPPTGPLTGLDSGLTLLKHISVIPNRHIDPETAEESSMHEQGFRAPEAKRIAGISYRQLDYWTRTGLVTPSVNDAHGSGTQRLYSFQDLATLKVIKKLLDTGISLQRVRKAVEYLRAMDRPPHGVTLMSDGTGVYEAHSPEAVIDLLRNGQGVFAISLDAVYSDLEDSVASAAKPRARRASTGGS